MKTFVIVPAFNEAYYLSNFLDKLTAVVSPKSIIVVNDGSCDNTADIAASRKVKTLTHLTNLGKGAALKTGCDYAFKKMGADAVIIMDGDDQHSPGDITLFLNELKRGTQVILGVRRLDAHMPLMRVLGNKFMSIVINLLFHRYIADIPSGFKAFTKSAYKSLKWQSAGYEVETEIAVRLARQHLSYAEVPISTVYRGKDYGFNLLDAWGILVKIPFWLWS